MNTTGHARALSLRRAGRALLLRRAGRLLGLVACAILLGPVGSGPMQVRAQPGQLSGASAALLRTAMGAVGELRLEDAEAALATLLADQPNHPDVLALQGVLEFHRGHYGAAVGHLERSGSAQASSLLDTVRATRDLLAGFEEAASDDGRYHVWFTPGPDRVLVPYALATLRAADDYVSRVLGHRVPGPIRLELYPDARSLAAVSTLTVQDIERSGTIALCKWDRLMVTSPRALSHGYAWADTISHELVHLILARASRDKAPVWMQEGIAKFLEAGYRSGADGFALDAVSQSILHDAAAEQRLLPFERLHPSIALLPSQRDAALAFAQVSTFVQGFQGRYGDTGLQRVVRRVSQGEDARQAFASAAGVSFDELEAAWRRDVRALPSPTRPRLLPRRLASGASGSSDASSSEELAGLGEQARRRLRLGDMLYARQRFAAAAVEYEAALEVASEDPVVCARFARSAIQSGAPERAVEALRPVVRTHPEYAPSSALLAAALHAAGEMDEARARARHAIRLNPFDPAPHCVLAATTEGPESLAEGQLCTTLGSAR